MGVYIEDALTEDEAADGYVLTCQMKPTSDCVINIPASSAACKTQVGTYAGRLTRISRDSRTTVSFSVQAEQPMSFLPGQYANLTVPGSKEVARVLVQLAAEPDGAVVPDPRRAGRPHEHLHAQQGPDR